MLLLETKRFLENEQATTVFAQKLAETAEQFFQRMHGSSPCLMVHLEGDLGAGKSFLSRALIQSFLPDQKVKSPTYTLVETYSIHSSTCAFDIHHFDLYRLCDPEELEYLAIRDLLTVASLNLVEWPSKGQGMLPPADLVIQLSHEECGRNARLIANSESGEALIKGI